MSEDQDEQNVSTMEAIARQRTPVFRKLSAVPLITPGASYIQNIKFLYPSSTSNVVTMVPVGEKFDFIVDYRAVNSSGNIVDPWSMCIVWWDVVDGPGLPTATAFTLNGFYWKNTEPITGSNHHR